MEVQAITPRDQYPAVTVPASRYLADIPSEWGRVLEATHLARPWIDSHGLREEPRIGYDPISDQVYVLIKLDRCGVTLIVSEHGLPFDEDEVVQP